MIERRYGTIAAAVAAVIASGCQQTPITVPVRSLERSGKSAFVCLGLGATPGRTTSDCGPYTAAGDDYSIPHLFGLVTQLSRGEVAVVDITAQQVVDADPSTPGFNFLPVGSVPTDIVATPGGTASFVSVAEPNKPGIFALPSTEIRGASPSLTSWPACRLPSAPGAMVLVLDPPAAGGALRRTCDASPGPNAPYTDVATGADLSACLSANPSLDLDAEQQPRATRKLLVALPDEGQLALVDAQALLCRAPGSFDPCPIERLWTLGDEVLSYGAERLESGAPARAPVCSAGIPEPGATGATGAPHPAQIAVVDPSVPGPKRLYVSDDVVPSIHVLDAPTPCDLAESIPLHPQSATDPTRTVVTTALAVSPLTRDAKRFLYAVDRMQGSIMAFDVSTGSDNPYPLVHASAELDPFEPRDRITFSSPTRALSFASRDVPYVDANGIAASGILCDPSPNASAAQRSYQAPADYSAGALPRNLRGVFGFALLENGGVAVIDVDDFDAPCRVPRVAAVSGTTALPVSAFDAVTGCAFPSGADWTNGTGDVSCNVVERNRTRSGVVFNFDQNAGRHAPTMQTYPLLLAPDGTVLATDQSDAGKDNPKLLGPSLLGHGESCPTNVSDANPLAPPCSYVTVNWNPVDFSLAQTTEKDAARNWVAFDLREPRVHFDQDWSIVYEGKIPGYAGHTGVGRLQCNPPAAGGNVPAAFACDPPDAPVYELWDPGASFCDAGVYDADIAAAQPAGPKKGDVLQITESYPEQDDPYWGSVGGTCSYLSCQVTFGPPDAPTSARDLVIGEAYQGHLVLEPYTVKDATDPSRPLPLRCCFPYPVRYAVRANQQWLVVGSAVGYEHHIVAREDGRCVESCDPYLSRLDGRAYAITGDGCSADSNACDFGEDSPYLFKNPQMQFSIWEGNKPAVRDMAFAFHESAGFVPLATSIASGTLLVSPQSMVLVPSLGALAVADGASQGLVLVDLGIVGVSQTFF